jgi:hypothetical protein
VLERTEAAMKMLSIYQKQQTSNKLLALCLKMAHFISSLLFPAV